MAPASLVLLLLATVDGPPVEPDAPGLFTPEFLIALAIFILAFIFLIDRPQKKRQEQLKKEVAGLKKGDRVVTTSGMHGTVARINKARNTVFVTIAKGVDVEFNQAALTRFREDPDAAKKEEKAEEAEEEPEDSDSAEETAPAAPDGKTPKGGSKKGAKAKR